MTIMDKSKFKIRTVVVRCVIIAVVLMLAILFCTTLKYENMRTSEVISPDTLTVELGDGDEVLQKIHIDENEDTLYGFGFLYLDMNANPKGSVKVYAYRDGEKIREWVTPGEFIRTTECEYYRFDKPQPAKGHEFSFKVTFEGFGDIKPFKLRTGPSDVNEKALVNGTKSTGTLCYLNIYERVSVPQMVLIPLAVFAVFTGWQCIWHFFLKKKLNLGEEADFASVYIALLLLYFIFVPIQSISDEEYHFLRSYTIAHGDLISQVSLNGEGGALVPEAVAKFADESYRNVFHNGSRADDEYIRGLVIEGDQMREYGFSNTAINMPLMYLPSVIGIGLSDIFTNRPYIMAYCGRFCNMLATIFLVLLAVRITPSGKGYFKFTALLPLLMQQSVSLAPDSFIMGLVMLYIALILRLRFASDQGELQLKDYIILYLMTVVIVLCKFVYAPLCLLLFLVPKEKFGKKSRYFGAIAVFALSVIAFLMSWMMIIGQYNIKFNRSDSNLQIRYILSNPGKALGIFANYILDSGNYMTDLTGGNLGFSNIILPSFTALIFIVIAVLWCRKMAAAPVSASHASRIIPAIIAVMVYLLVGLSEYVGWTKVGASAIYGVTGRYFLQILPLILFALSGIEKDCRIDEGFREKTTFVSVMLNLFAIVSIWIYTVY